MQALEFNPFAAAPRGSWKQSPPAGCSLQLPPSPCPGSRRIVPTLLHKHRWRTETPAGPEMGACTRAPLRREHGDTSCVLRCFLQRIQGVLPGSGREGACRGWSDPQALTGASHTLSSNRGCSKSTQGRQTPSCPPERRLVPWHPLAAWQ